MKKSAGLVMKFVSRPICQTVGLMLLLLSLFQISQAQTSEPAVQVLFNENQLRIVARQAEMQIRLVVKNQLGETLYDSGFNHYGTLPWNLTDNEAKPLAGGLYRYTLTLQDTSGATARTHQGNLILEQNAERLWLTTQDETLVGTDIVGGALTITREAGRTIAGLTNQDKQPKRDVSGRGLIDENGNQLPNNNDHKVASPNVSKALLGTLNRLAKFDTNGTNLLDSAIFESGGNVGVGTTFPVAQLTVSANTAAPPAQPGILGYFANTDENNSFITVDAYGHTSNWHSDFLFRRARGTMAAPQAVQADDILGQIQARGYGATGFASTSRAGLRFTAAENWSDTAQGAFLAFMTTPKLSNTINVERMRITDAGNVGIGITTPTTKLHVSGGNGTAVYGETAGGAASFGVWGVSTANGGYGVYGYSDTTVGAGYGVYGQAKGEGTAIHGNLLNATTGYAGYFNGKTHVNGALSKSSGSFKIDHPLDPANKYLYHSFVESPDMMNIYNGNVTTDQLGMAVITLPDYFESLNREFRYQLTVIGKFAQAIVSEEINGNQFRVETNQPYTKVSWQVTGVRQDAYAEAHRIPTEELKPERERGTYLHPEVHGQPEEKGLEWVRQPEMRKQMKEQQEKAQKEKKAN